MKPESGSVIFATRPICVISRRILPKLKEMAEKSPLKRARFCLHRSEGDAVQEMVICLHRQTHIRPHRHLNKSESFHMIEGTVLILLFDDRGAVETTIQLSATGEFPFLYRLSVGKWHCVISLTEYAVFHEVSMGPFSPCEYPSWEEERTIEEIVSFRDKVLAPGDHDDFIVE